MKNRLLPQEKSLMDLREKSLYHQIHPAKLFTDIVAAAISLYLLWQHDLVTGLVVAFVPLTIASFVVMQLANLEKYKRSAFGRYLNECMTGGLQLARIGSFVAMVVGAWYHALWLVLLSLLVILLCWFRGVLLPN